MKVVPSKPLEREIESDTAADMTGELSIWAKMIKLCTILCLIPASFNKQTNRFVFRIISWKFLVHLVIWQIIPIGIDYFINFLLYQDERGEETKTEKLIIKDYVFWFSYVIKKSSEGIITISVSFSLAYLLSTAKISIMKIKRPQRWLLLTISAIFTILPSSMETYNLIYLSTIGGVKLFNVFMLVSKILLVFRRLLGWLIVELYFSSFRKMAEQCKETRTEDLAQSYNNLIYTYVSLQTGFGPGLLVSFSVNLGNLIGCVYLLTQSAPENEYLDNVIDILIIGNQCYYFCTSCQMCYNKLTEGSQVLSGFQRIEKKIIIIVDRMASLNANGFEKEKLEKALDSLLEQGPFTAHGYFTVEKSTLVSIFSVTLTYFIILLQFSLTQV